MTSHLDRCTENETRRQDLLPEVLLFNCEETHCDTGCIHSHQTPVCASFDPETGEGKAILYTTMENMTEYPF